MQMVCDNALPEVPSFCFKRLYLKIMVSSLSEPHQRPQYASLAAIAIRKHGVPFWPSSIPSNLTRFGLQLQLQATIFYMSLLLLSRMGLFTGQSYRNRAR